MKMWNGAEEYHVKLSRSVMKNVSYIKIKASVSSHLLSNKVVNRSYLTSCIEARFDE